MNFVTEYLHNTALEKLFNQKQSNSFCDLTLIVNGKVIKAHRNVLSAVSPYFDSILKHHKITREQLIINCNQVSTFEAIIDYMYTGRIFIEHATVEELLQLADCFLVAKVIEYCIEFLGTKLSLENCLFTFYLTQKFKLKQLGSLVENWIDTHLLQICDGNEILSLASQQLHEFLKRKAFALPFTKTLKIISDWSLQNVIERAPKLNKLFECIQWTNVDPNEVYKYLEICELYSVSDLSLYYILHQLMLNNMLSANYKVKYNELHGKYEQTLKAEEKVDNKIVVAERDGNNMIAIKVKNKNRKEQLLLKLLAGLKPNLRAAAIKAIRKKNKKIRLVDYLTDNVEFDSDVEEKVGVKCPICSANINDSTLLEQHLALSHSKDVTYKCGACNFVCQYHGDYLNHSKTHFPGPPFKCDFCDFTGDQISKLIAHRVKHLDETLFQCTFCSYKCRTKPNYLAHLKLHSSKKSFKCDQCTKTFKHKHNLDTHLQTHSSDKTFNCNSCGFYTKIFSNLIAHKRIHAGEMLRCSYPHCKFSTLKKSQLLTHAKSHNGTRPHTCGVCGRGFMEKSHLVRHERIHLEEKPFKCSNCDYASSRRDKLKEHFTRHHGENASAKTPYKARPMRGSSAPTKASKPPTNEMSQNNDSNNTNNVNYSNSSANNNEQPMGEMQQLLLQHQNGSAALNSSYHHFGDSSDFHTHTHNIQQHILGHNQRHNQHPNGVVNHQLLNRSNHSTSMTSSAAAVAAAMMLDPRFHHNTSVAYSTTTPSVAMAGVPPGQQVQPSNQSSEFPSHLQNCMPLF